MFNYSLFRLVELANMGKQESLSEQRASVSAGALRQLVCHVENERGWQHKRSALHQFPGHTLQQPMATCTLRNDLYQKEDDLSVWTLIDNSMFGVDMITHMSVRVCFEIPVDEDGKPVVTNFKRSPVQHMEIKCKRTGMVIFRSYPVVSEVHEEWQGKYPSYDPSRLLFGGSEESARRHLEDMAEADNVIGKMWATVSVPFRVTLLPIGYIFDDFVVDVTMAPGYNVRTAFLDVAADYCSSEDRKGVALGKCDGYMIRHPSTLDVYPVTVHSPVEVSITPSDVNFVTRHLMWRFMGLSPEDERCIERIDLLFEGKIRQTGSRSYFKYETLHLADLRVPSVDTSWYQYFFDTTHPIGGGGVTEIGRGAVDLSRVQSLGLKIRFRDGSAPQLDKMQVAFTSDSVNFMNRHAGTCALKYI